LFANPQAGKHIIKKLIMIDDLHLGKKDEFEVKAASELL
jgi:hypothetical protein